MKTFFAVFIFCFLLLSANPNHARKEPGDYWKSVMKDQPMPEAIKGLLHQDPASALGSEKNMKHFVKDFDTKHSVIIYDSGPQSKVEDNPHVKDLKDQKQQKSDKKN
ncbi:hypothetical protein QUC31_015760 [Theobroma cacao]|uniref:Organ-specific protein P4, putative n=1 Tax=Theobroma cacao TaxID=3641 RepID=A0A061DY34_THECC|nr:Organ-specific protein P4, putative [Theobroma cacao]